MLHVIMIQFPFTIEASFLGFVINHYFNNLLYNLYYINQLNDFIEDVKLLGIGFFYTYLFYNTYDF